MATNEDAAKADKKGHGPRCPYCKGSLRRGPLVDAEDGDVIRGVDCRDCRRHWFEHYAFARNSEATGPDGG